MICSLGDERSGQEAIRAAIVRETARWLGTPYVHQGATRGVGADCLGLLVGIWNAISDHPFALARTDQRAWAYHAHGEPLLDGLDRFLCPLQQDRPRPGDVLALRWRQRWPASHVAVLMPAQTIIHAYEGGAVVRSKLAPWANHVAAAYAFPCPPSLSKSEVI